MPTRERMNRISAEEEREIDLAYQDRDTARANARRLRSALEEKTKEIEELRAALQRVVNWKTDKEHWQDIAYRALLKTKS